MNILISGASGYIGTLLRERFPNDAVTLMSRRPITPRRAEEWVVAGNLQENDWWGALPMDRTYDVVFHLAEPVKIRVSDAVKQGIIDAHVAFINYFTSKGAKVIYPLTAYLYDTVVSPPNRIYAEIKREVYTRLLSNKQASFPIVHPIYDHGDGLARLVRLDRRIPLINAMCAFDSSLPVLKLADLMKVLSMPLSMSEGRFDIYSQVLPIRDVFKKETRANVYALSRAFLYALRPFTFVSTINLLVNGRRINVC